MVKQALHPNYFEDTRKVLSSLKEEKVEEIDTAVHEEKLLHSLQSHDGWKVVTDYIDSVIAGLDGQVLALMEAGADYATIGQKTVVKEICKEMLLKVKEKVSDARNPKESE